MLGADYDTAVDGEYIVIFKSEVSEDVGELHTMTLYIVIIIHASNYAVKLHKEKIKELLAKGNQCNHNYVQWPRGATCIAFCTYRDCQMR